MTGDERKTVENMIARLEAEASSLRKLSREREHAVVALVNLAHLDDKPGEFRRMARAALDALDVPSKPAEPSIAEWLEERFREQRGWHVGDLRILAREAGFDTDRLFSHEVAALPINRWKIDSEGTRNWLWTAMDGWPGPAEGGAA